MGRITYTTTESHILALCVTVGGFTLGTIWLGVATSAALSILLAYFTLLIANLYPNDPTFGPHQ